MIFETPTIDEQPGQQHAIVSLPEHLRDDAEFLRCSVCQRAEYCLDCDGERCGMTQPNGLQCGGVFRSLPRKRCDNVVERLSKERIRTVLIQIAAEMVRGKNMPSEFIEDWDLPVATSRKTRQRIIDQARASRGQCIDWSGTLRRVYDLLVHGLSD